MDGIMYDLYNNTKTALCSDILKEIKKSDFCTFFTKLLEDCSVCVSQSLDSTVHLLCETNLNLKKLIEYIEEAVCLLQLMSNFIKNVVESVSMTCCNMKSFPTTTGQILVTVFKHCRDSEQIYGGHLMKVGEQLKDLFRTCHELQITYLMILEKSFLFDLTESEEQDVLINALQMNLEVGEIVQGLDVKTLAEQWKAYTAMCEKYSAYLMDKNVYNKCTQILCRIINNNIVNSLEVGLDEKVVIRSLKVTSFIIKIFLKLTNTFRNSSIEKQNDIMETLINVYTNNEAYLELDGRAPQFINLIKSNVLIPTDHLLGELLKNESFVNCLFRYDVTSLDWKDEKVLGYIIFLTTIIKHMMQDDANLKVSSHKLVICVFDCVSCCHIWFNMPLKFDGESINSDSTYGLYEHLLSHTAAVSLTLSSEELCALEKLMCEQLLSTNCWIGLFASNLWVLIARMSSQYLISSHLVSLCRIYQKLEAYALFASSPQQIHLSATITRLFELLDKDNKTRMFRHFSPVYDETNINLWIALKMNNVPWDIRCELEEDVIEKCKMAIDKFCTSNLDNEEIRQLIKIVNLLATFSLTADKMGEHLLKAWMCVCLKNNSSISKAEFDKSTIWFLEYVQAITELTYSMKNTFFANPMNLIKALHVISTLIQNGNTQLKLHLIEPLCKYATLHKPDNKSSVELLASESFLILFQSDVSVKGKLFVTLHKYMHDVKMDKIISLTMNQENVFRESWNFFLQKSKWSNFNKTNILEQLEITMKFNYVHKCLENESELLSFKKDIDFNNSNFVQLERKSSENFDLVDVDDIFDNDSDAEPTCKKMKYTNEAKASDIVCRLENDTLLLYKIKENLFDADIRRRVKIVSEQLRNIIE
ncbi:FIGNL1-interacting regulator of recombination and mitosis-like [Plodia interpunctella]|uniref:FIGNL1-interacting regulator of recombination and mitosis-like n=1 Tax=Plodia interpunctella TaxID=58824 RepID=UPI002368046F|nr:uncharacterized protein C1orf112 homolog [Plodia interpunctella]